MTSRRRRLDAEMMRRGLASSRSEAKRLIDERLVRIGGAVAEKASRQVQAADAIEISAGRPRFVSRGGYKLEAALDAFGVDPTGLRVVDVGASTGGFTDCLLQRGAAHVIAVDVGRNQLHERLRADGRVTSLERTDVRAVEPLEIGGPAPLVVADLSFISLRKVAVELRRLSSADILALVKPQFEAGKAEADRGKGVIEDPEVWRQALLGVISSLTAVGTVIRGLLASPLLGASGNVEFLLHARARDNDPAPVVAGGLGVAGEVAVGVAREIGGGSAAGVIGTGDALVDGSRPGSPSALEAIAVGGV